LRLEGVRGKFRAVAIGAVTLLLGVELVLGWSSLTGALRQLRTPHLGWLLLAVVAELAAMNAYGRMQRHLLHSAGVRAPLVQYLRLAYAAHSLNETLPGGPAFSTRFNYQQMRGFGASPGVASWAIALSGILSSGALAGLTLAGALAAGGKTQWQHLVWLTFAAVALTFGVRHLARHPQVLRRPLALVNRVRRRPAGEGEDRIRGFVEQLHGARLTPLHGFAAAALAVLNWFLDAVCLWLSFRAVGETPAGLTVALLAFCAGMAAGSITIVPGGLGIIYSALILGLMAGGVAAPAAVAVVVLYRVITLGFILGIGWLSWLGLRSPRPRTARPAVVETRTARPAVMETRTARPAVMETRTARPAVAETRTARPAVAETRTPAPPSWRRGRPGPPSWRRERPAPPSRRRGRPGPPRWRRGRPGPPS
jgi:uncharacterized membrane protein YbhN (UPF0104 family)